MAKAYPLCAFNDFVVWLNLRLLLRVNLNWYSEYQAKKTDVQQMFRKISYRRCIRSWGSVSNLALRWQIFAPHKQKKLKSSKRILAINSIDNSLFKAPLKLTAGLICMVSKNLAQANIDNVWIMLNVLVINQEICVLPNFISSRYGFHGTACWGASHPRPVGQACSLWTVLLGQGNPVVGVEQSVAVSYHWWCGNMFF